MGFSIVLHMQNVYWSCSKVKSATCAWPPGVGAYTSRSVASIGCQEAVAAVDANVVRVLARLRRCSLPGIGPGAATYQDLANQLLNPDRPGDFNQVLI